MSTSRLSTSGQDAKKLIARLIRNGEQKADEEKKEGKDQ